jgi:hypothetical protein
METRPTVSEPSEALPRPPLSLPDPDRLMRTCANCGSAMEERKCKLICNGCGYFLSCSDYY